MAFVAPLIASIGSFAGSAAGALSIASAGVSALGAIQAGNYQAAVAKNNSEIALENAGREADAAQQRQIRSDREYAAQGGEQLALQGASGLDVLGRTQLATRRVTEQTGRAAAKDIRLEGQSTAQRFMQDSANFRAEASQAKKQAAFSAIGSVLDLGVTATKGMKSRKGSPKSLVGGSKVMPWTSNVNWYKRG